MVLVRTQNFNLDSCCISNLKILFYLKKDLCTKFGIYCIKLIQNYKVVSNLKFQFR